MYFVKARLGICAWLLVGLLTQIEPASAAPPANCAYKFIGTWVYPGGKTVVAPGGTAYPKCLMCVPTQTWTCRGNTYLFSNSGPPGQFSATLSADGRQLVGSGVVATRVGGPAQAPPSKVAEAKPAKPKQPVAPTQGSSPPAPTRNSSGSSLAPGTFDRSDTTNVPPPGYRPQEPPLKSVHMGNYPISEPAGPTSSSSGKEGQGPTHGLTLAKRQLLDDLRNDQPRLIKYLRTLNAQEQEQALSYLEDPLTVASAGGSATKVLADPNDCAGMWERLKPHALDDAWIRWHMAQAHCHDNGTPMSLREVLEFELSKPNY